MFNKLVISTNERRKGRIVSFFCGTSALYALVIVGVLALSVVVSNPRLADTSDRMLALIATPPPPSAPPPARQPETTPPPAQPRNDPTQVRDLDSVVSAPTPTRRPAAPPSLNDSIGVVGAPESSGDPNSTWGVPNSPAHGEMTPPPPPPVEPHRPTPQVDTTRPVRLISSVLQGKAVVRRTPDYPPLAKQIHLSGSVSVEVMVAPDGHVEAVRGVSGHPMLMAAALEAARGWRFEPTLLNGTPVRVSGVIVFNFTMQ